MLRPVHEINYQRLHEILLATVKHYAIRLNGHRHSNSIYTQDKFECQKDHTIGQNQTYLFLNNFIISLDFTNPTDQKRLLFLINIILQQNTAPILRDSLCVNFKEIYVTKKLGDAIIEMYGMQFFDEKTFPKDIDFFRHVSSRVCAPLLEDEIFKKYYVNIQKFMSDCFSAESLVENCYVPKIDFSLLKSTMNKAIQRYLIPVPSDGPGAVGIARANLLRDLMSWLDVKKAEDNVKFIIILKVLIDTDAKRLINHITDAIFRSANNNYAKAYDAIFGAGSFKCYWDYVTKTYSTSDANTLYHALRRDELPRVIDYGITSLLFKRLINYVYQQMLFMNPHLKREYLYYERYFADTKRYQAILNVVKDAPAANSYLTLLPVILRTKVAASMMLTAPPATEATLEPEKKKIEVISETDQAEDSNNPRKQIRHN